MPDLNISYAKHLRASVPLELEEKLIDLAQDDGIDDWNEYSNKFIIDECRHRLGVFHGTDDELIEWAGEDAPAIKRELEEFIQRFGETCGGHSFAVAPLKVASAPSRDNYLLHDDGEDHHQPLSDEYLNS